MLTCVCVCSIAQPARAPAPSGDSLEAEKHLSHVTASPRTVVCAPSLHELTLTGICEGGGAPSMLPTVPQSPGS